MRQGRPFPCLVIALLVLAGAGASAQTREEGALAEAAAMIGGPEPHILPRSITDRGGQRWHPPRTYFKAGAGECARSFYVGLTGPFEAAALPFGDRDGEVADAPWGGTLRARWSPNVESQPSTSIAYDAEGRPVEVVTPPPPAGAGLTWQWNYPLYVAEASVAFTCDEAGISRAGAEAVLRPIAEAMHRGVLREGLGGTTLPPPPEAAPQARLSEGQRPAETAPGPAERPTPGEPAQGVTPPSPFAPDESVIPFGYKPVPGIESIGGLPGPRTLIETIGTVVVPGIAAVLIAVLNGLLGGRVAPPSSGGRSGPRRGDTRTILDGRARPVEDTSDETIGAWETAEERLIRIAREGRQQDAAFIDEQRHKLETRDTAWDRALDAVVEQHQREAQTLQDIYKLATGIRNLQAKDSLGYTEGQAENMLRTLNRMSRDLVEGKPPTEDQLTRMRALVRKEMDAERAHRDAREYDWVSEGAHATAREIFAGTNSDGETSYKSMALRGLIGAATGGQSEYVMEVAEKMYGVHDDIHAGKTGLQAFGNAAGRVIFDEAFGRLTEKGMALGGAVAGGAYSATLKGTHIEVLAGKRMQQVGKFLNKDVGDLIGAHRPKPLNPSLPAKPFKPLSQDLVDQRSAAFAKGRESGAAKVAEFEKAAAELDDAVNQRFAEQATKKGSPTGGADRVKECSAKLQQALDKVQQDKHAMQVLNRRKDPAADKLRKTFTEEIGKAYDQAHEASIRRIAQEYGVSPDSVKVVKPTNAPGAVPTPDPGGFARRPRGSPITDGKDPFQKPGRRPSDAKSDKVSFDQDITYRVKQTWVDPQTGKTVTGYRDVRKSDARRIYEQEFYKARHNGALPYRVDKQGKRVVDVDAIHEYNHKMDQSVTDRLDPEAYGTGDKDLQTATNSNARGRDFSDVQGVGKTMEHKQYEWRNQALELQEFAARLREKAAIEAASGNATRAAKLNAKADGFAAAAEGRLEEGFRQTTKQFKNQTIARVDAINAAMKKPVARISPRLREAVSIMDQCGNPGFSPAQVEQKLLAIGYTPEKVIEQMASTMESLQKFKPSDLPRAPKVDHTARIIGQTITKSLKEPQDGRPPSA